MRLENAVLHTNETKAMECRIEELLVGVTWTHKVHEKQADIYEAYGRCLTFASLFLVALTASGITCVLLSDLYVLKLVSAVLSFASVFTSLLAMTVDYSGRAQGQRQAAKAFLGLREDTRTLLCKVRAEAISSEDLMLAVGDLVKRYKDACMVAPSTTDKALAKAKASLGKGESTVTEGEKERMVSGYEGGAR